MERLFLGIDQGSSSTKAVLLDSHGQHYFQQSIAVSTRIDGEKVEQSPQELLQSCRDLIDEAIRAAQRQRMGVAAIGLSFQRSGVCAWDSETGSVVHQLISHRDTRTLEKVAALSESSRLITQKSGMPVSPAYAAGKIATLQKEFGEQGVRVSTLDSYIVQQLTGDCRFITEDSMAARTMLYDLDLASWDPELCSLFMTQIDRLPDITSSIGQHGTYRGIPISVMLGDQQAGLVARRAEGQNAVLNIGTLSSISVGTGHEIKRVPGFITTILFSRGFNQREYYYMVEGVKNNVAAVVELLRKQFRLGQSLADITSLCHQDSKGSAVGFFPMGPVETPHWSESCPNVLLGWEKGNLPGLARALISSVGAFIVEQIKLLQAAQLLIPGDSISVSGGLSEIDFLLQYIADVSNCELVRMASREGSVRGAALAAMRLGIAETHGALLPKDQSHTAFHSNDSANRQHFARWCALRDQVLSKEIEDSTIFENIIRAS